MAKIIPFPKDKLGGYSIIAKAKEAEVWIYDDIGSYWGEGLSAKQFAEDIKALGEVETITVHLNSPGGNPFEGVAMHSTLRSNKAKIIINVDGWAASAASIVAMAGDEINIAEGGIIMIHEAAKPTFGTAEDHRQAAAMLTETNSAMTKIYARRSSLDEEEVAALMAAETWMGAEQAIEFGFADQITEALEIAAYVDLERFKYRHAPVKAKADDDTEADKPPEPKLDGNSNDDKPATPKPAEVVEPPEPKLQEPPAAVLSTEDSPLNPKNFESRRKQRIDTTYGRKE